MYYFKESSEYFLSTSLLVMIIIKDSIWNIFLKKVQFSIFAEKMNVNQDIK